MPELQQGRPKVLISLTDGIGNQLFQLAAALSFGGDSEIGLEWQLLRPRLTSDGRPDIATFALPSGVSLEPRRRQVRKFEVAATYLMVRVDQSNRFHGGKLGATALRISTSLVVSNYLKERRAIVEARGIGYSSMSLPHGKSLLVGYFQSYRWAEAEKTLMKLRNLRIATDSKAVAEFENLAKKENPLVVHIRLGDYKGLNLFGIPSRDYYAQAIAEQMETGKYGKIWVFSNEPSLAKEILPESVRHSVRWVPEIEESAAKTLEVMRYGHGYVIGNSTFSWWGAFLSYSDNPKVIAPQPWFREMESPKDLIPPQWTTHQAWGE